MGLATGGECYTRGGHSGRGDQKGEPSEVVQSIPFPLLAAILLTRPLGTQYVDKYSAMYWGTSFVGELGRMRPNVPPMLAAGGGLPRVYESETQLEEDAQKSPHADVGL